MITQNWQTDVLQTIRTAARHAIRFGDFLSAVPPSVDFRVLCTAMRNGGFPYLGTTIMYTMF
jgi:hypothetical protein